MYDIECLNNVADLTACVHWRSITELQEQNQRLLQSLRELSDKQEAAEFAVVDEK